MHDAGSSPTEPARAAIVAGATGVVGHFLLPRLVAAGWTAHAVSRRAARPSPGVQWHLHDSARGLDGLPAEADTWFHAAPLWLLPPLVPAMAARGVRRIVALGSTSRFTKAHSAVGRALARAEEELAAAG